MSASHSLPDPDLTRTRAVTRAFEDAGTVSPATARPLAEVLAAGDIDERAVLPLVPRRAVREAGAGRYYLHASPEYARRRRLLLILMLLVSFLVPAVLVQLAAHAR